MEKVRNKAYNLLRWSEQYTQTDMVYLAKGGFWVTVGQLFGIVASFGIAIAFANLLPGEIYGNYQFVLATTGILAASSLSGLNVAAVRSVARGAEGILLPSFKTKLKWSTIGSLIAIIIASYYFWRTNEILAISFLLVALFLPIFYSLGISGALLEGKKLFKTSAKYNTSNQIFASACIIIALFLTDNLFLILMVYFISWTLAKTITFILTIKKYKTNDVTDHEMVSYGKHLSVMGIFAIIADNLDKLLLFYFLGPLEVAIYSFATAPVMQIKGVMKNINSLALPKLSLRTKEEIRATIISRNLQIFLVSLPIILAYILAAPFIYKIFFPAYLDSVIYSQVFALAVLFTAPGTFSSASLEAEMEVKKKYILTFFSKISKIVLMLVLVVPFGVWGIVSAVVANSFVVNIVGIILIKKK
ncbi:MAG: oligosaccharide flippase family protein [Crocinitomicaceae bacterium]